MGSVENFLEERRDALAAAVVGRRRRATRASGRERHIWSMGLEDIEVTSVGARPDPARAMAADTDAPPVEPDERQVVTRIPPRFAFEAAKAP
jgi:hypothetical protein